MERCKSFLVFRCDRLVVLTSLSTDWYHGFVLRVYVRVCLLDDEAKEQEDEEH